MKTGAVNSILISLFACLLGCTGNHPRPANVPPSAVWVDSTFIDCSVEKQSRANRCTVWKDDTGEMLADGLFVLNTSFGPADTSELNYAAFGNGVIFLADARKLVHWAASARDPSSRLVDDRLRALAGSGAMRAIDCRSTATSGKSDAASECARRAFADRKPFYVRFYYQGFDSFGYEGFAGDAYGNLYGVNYDSMGWTTTGWPKGAQLFDDNHIVAIPCPKPVALIKTENGQLTCAKPVPSKKVLR